MLFCPVRDVLCLQPGLWGVWYTWLRYDGWSDAGTDGDHLHLLDEVTGHHQLWHTCLLRCGGQRQRFPFHRLQWVSGILRVLYHTVHICAVELPAFFSDRFSFFWLFTLPTDGSSMWMVRSGSLTVLLWTRVYGTTLGCPGGVGMETGESTSMGSPQTEAKACQSAPLSQV